MSTVFLKGQLSFDILSAYVQTGSKLISVVMYCRASLS